MQKWRGNVEMIRRVTSPKGRAFAGAYSIEGLRLHERALRAGIPLETAVVADAFFHAADTRIQQLLAELQATACDLHVVPDAVMAELTNGRSLGAIISLVPLPQPPDLADLIATAASPTLLVAVDVIDPGNVGALVRTAHASGCTTLVTLGASDPFHPKAVRTSMGSIFKLPTVSFATLDALLMLLKDAEIETVGTAVDDGIPLPQATFPTTGTALFMGNEYWGLPATITANFDQNVTIPMAAGIDSFSVNAATAIILYEIKRQSYH